MGLETKKLLLSKLNNLQYFSSFMRLKLLFPILLFSVLISQKIVHNPITNFQMGESLQVEATIIGLNSDNQNHIMTLFYRSVGQETYFTKKMKFINGVYRYTIPVSFLDSGVEYFILLETDSGGVYAFPDQNPKENPVFIAPEKGNEQIFNLQQTSSGKLIPNYQILSPDDGARLLYDDLLISLSYFKMENLDISHTKIIINDIDYTSSASIKDTHFSLLINDRLEIGDYQIKVFFKSLNGLEYEPIIWNFKIIDEVKESSQNIIISKGGNLSGNFNSSQNDGSNLSIGELSGDYHIDLDWMKIKTDFLLSSLNDSNEQPKNRMLFDFKTDFFDIKLGDSYPIFSEYTISGTRLRGANILYNNNNLKVHFLSGSLTKTIQGLGNDGAMILLENQVPQFSSSGILDDSDESMGIVDLSRDNYTFNRGLIGLKVDFKMGNKSRWNLELLKIKDKIESVDHAVDGSMLTLPEDMSKHLFSDIYVDYDGSGSYTPPNEYNICYNNDGGDCQYTEFIGNKNEQDHDVVGSTNWDGISEIMLDTSFISNFTYSTVPLGIYTYEPFIDGNGNGEYDSYCSIDGIQEIDQNILTEFDCNSLGVEYQWISENFDDIDGDGEWSDDGEYDILQNQISIDIKYEYLDEVINYFKQHEEDSHGDTIVEDITDHAWSECTYNDCFGDYRINLLSSQWEGDNPEDNIVLSSGLLHTFDDGLLKIKYGFAFSMLNQNIWNPAISYQSLDEFGAENSEQESDGLFNNEYELDESIDNIQKFEDIFKTGISQVPLIPIDVSDGKITFKDFLTLPSAALYFDASHKYFGHNISWGFRQVGPEFHSLGNPYIQSNIREQYFSDRTYLLDNKLNLSFKWKRTEDGISLTENNGKSDKYDINLGFFPGVGVPTYNLTIGIYTRQNGVDPIYEPLVYVTPENDIGEINGEVDTWSCELQQVYDFICTEEELEAGEKTEEYEILETQLYQPEKTLTGQFSLSINGSFNYIYRHNYSINIFYSNKRDLINISKYIAFNNDYYSPRSLTQSYNFSTRTKFSDRLETAIITSYSYYDYGNEERYQTYRPEYFQYQSIYAIDLSAIYDTRSWSGKLNPAINISLGRGSNEFNQFSFRGGSQIPLINNLSFSLNMNYKLKFINLQNIDHNYSFYMNLKYKF